ncbi:MAG: gliding motility-associated ABC transporter substrate-binding protein GldG [Flavobacteriaceae bacterium]
MIQRSDIYRLLAAMGIILVCMQALSFINLQWDLTLDQRYTLSENTVEIVEGVKEPVIIDVMLGGNLPANYQRLRTELTILLKQVNHQNEFVQYNFVDPFEGVENKEGLIEELYRFGLAPEIEIDQESQSTEQTIVVPWMILNIQDNTSLESKSIRVPLLQKNLGDTPEQRVEQSIQQLEYNLTDGLHRLFLKNKKSIAVVSSHKGSSDLQLASLLQSLTPYYRLASFDLKAFPAQPAKTLENLNRFDLLFIANPTEQFTNQEKFMLDQYTQQGGNSLYLIDPITIARDSLFSIQGDAVAFPTNLGLEELFFKYGIRLNRDIVTDLFSAPIVLAQGENASSEYRPYPWVYHPLVEPTPDHPIGSAVGNVLQQFVSSIDTLKNQVNKTVLLTSSKRSKLKKPPFVIALEEATKPLKPSLFDEESKITGVLLEGSFPSLFQNRISPFEWDKITDTRTAKIAIFSDGNMAENQLDKGNPLELGYDKWTNNLYANKQFLQNTVHYLMGEDKRLILRSKEIRLAFLDQTLVREEKQRLQRKVFALPLALLAFVGFICGVLRRKAYRQ